MARVWLQLVLTAAAVSLSAGVVEPPIAEPPVSEPPVAEALAADDACAAEDCALGLLQHRAVGQAGQGASAEMATTSGHVEAEPVEASVRSTGPSCQDLQRSGLRFDSCNRHYNSGGLVDVDLQGWRPDVVLQQRLLRLQPQPLATEPRGLIIAAAGAAAA
eukprot:CAMPEP_0171087512 /NCGR_PEP_ID=MMETSP0766_2-20121228/20198_1 /TAXON_ID=439317 /ORGANISM="Gambierdiscus australes, Strain CAWD 149" /LENGTH=160 /DNA_ID=CAMNT_0011545225 /DNA_START=84 /DNA_END=562 /DNA_ORIENTATION=+